MHRINADDPWENLAMAIIIAAIEDYCKALKSSKDSPDLLAEVDSIERFFRSRFFSVLTPVSGELLIERLRKGDES